MKRRLTLNFSIALLVLLAASAHGQRQTARPANSIDRLLDPLGLFWHGRNGVPARSGSDKMTPGRASPAAAGKTYNFITVDYPGAAFSAVFGSNGKTDVGDFFFDPSSSSAQPLVHTATKYTTLLIPDSTYAVVTGINSVGTMCGVYRDTSGRQLGFTYNGVVTPFAISGSIRTTVRGINDAGDLVGDYDDDSGALHGFVDIGGLITSIDYPGASGTRSLAINNFGQAVGSWLDSSNSPHGFIWSNGVFTNLDFPGALATILTGINDTGKIVGDTFDATTHGFLYDGAFKTIDVVGAKGIFLTHIDNQGRITGSYADALNEVHGFKGH